MFKSFIKQIAINESGGVRITIYKQSYNDASMLIQEQPHQMTWGLFDDVDYIIEVNNTHLNEMGFPSVDPQELELAHLLRATAHAHPPVMERIKIETEKREAATKAQEAATVEAAKAQQTAIDKQVAAFDEAVKQAVDRHLAATGAVVTTKSF